VKSHGCSILPFDILLPTNRVKYARRDAIFSTIKRKQTFRVDNESCQARSHPIDSLAIAEFLPYIISRVTIFTKYITRVYISINRMMHFSDNREDRRDENDRVFFATAILSKKKVIFFDKKATFIFLAVDFFFSLYFVTRYIDSFKLVVYDRAAMFAPNTRCKVPVVACDRFYTPVHTVNADSVIVLPVSLFRYPMR